jgi:hypothetical protein
MGGFMIRASRVFLFVALVVCQIYLAASSFAQSRNEAGLVIGSTVTPSLGVTTSPGSARAPDLHFQSSLALGAEYDRTLYSSARTSIAAGVDFLASPFDVKLDHPPAFTIPGYAYIFLTPHVRVKFRPENSFSPWLLLGGGYARFRETSPRGVTGFSIGTNTGALEVGAGLDTKPLVKILRIPIGFRAEVRDFYSGRPRYGVSVPSNGQNNVVFTGGLLLRF